MRETIRNAEGINNIIIGDIFKAIEFINGMGKVSTKIKTSGKYILILKVKVDDNTLKFNQSLPVKVIE